MMRRFLIMLVITLISLCLFAVSASAQMMQGRYPKGRIFLTSGMMIEGKNVILTGDTVTMDGRTYQLSEVQQVMIKKGKAPRYAAGCAGGCAALLCLLTIAIASTDDSYYDDSYYYDTGQLIASSLVWVAIFYGGGYLLGDFADDWTPVYFAGHTERRLSPGPLYPQLTSTRGKSDWLLFRRGIRF